MQSANVDTGQVDRMPLVALLTANAISQVGSMLSVVAIPWFVLVTTGSAAKTGLVGFVTTVPLILVAFFGGTLVNSLGFKPTSVAADVASALSVAAIPALYHAAGLDFWQLLVFVFLRSALGTPGTTARQSLFPDLAVCANVPLPRANAAQQAIWRLSYLLGPPLAGVLIAVMGVSNVLWLDAASFAGSALLIGMLVPGRAIIGGNQVDPELEAPRRHSSRRELLDGLRFILHDRLILLLSIASTLGNALGAATFDVVLPVYARRDFGNATALGLMLGGFGGGALVSVLLFGLMGYRLPKRVTMIGSLIAGAIPAWIIATTPPLWLSVAALVLDGLSSGPFGPIVSSTYQERVPVGLRGPFFGAMLALDNGLTPLSILAAGLLLAHFNLVTMLIVLAAANLLVVLVIAPQPRLADLDTP